jgi:hypothetical protein
MELYIGAPQSNTNNLFNILQKTSGAVIRLGNQSRMSNEAFDIKPGVCTNVKFSKNVVEKLPQPFSDCVDTHMYSSEIVNLFKAKNYTYAQKNCLVCLIVLKNYFLSFNFFSHWNRRFAINATL